MLGDGWIEKPKVNARFRFEQSHTRKDFFFYLYEFFSPYCKNAPILRERLDKRTNKVYSTWHFSTKCSPTFTEMYELFYKDKNKVVTTSIIELMGPASLAFLIMSDGWKHNKGVTIATNAFSEWENEMLVKAFCPEEENFGLDCRLIRDHKYPSIHISFRCLPQLQNITVPYMHESMLYKIYL